jgi:protein-S-isoprenylcysteine O-methyltransferase Ste14
MSFSAMAPKPFETFKNSGELLETLETIPRGQTSWMDGSSPDLDGIHGFFWRLMTDLISRIIELPSYGIGGSLILLLYFVQSEIRFGGRARASRPGTSDHNSTLALSASCALLILVFMLAMKSRSVAHPSWLLRLFQKAIIPGLPATAWLGVLLGVIGLALRLWGVLTLRERYTKTLLVLDQHSVERGGPYRWVRHPGYLGSLFCLNGIALASGNWITLLASLVSTSAAYAYRIKVEDEMLVDALGPPYAEYRRQVRALLPSFRSRQTDMKPTD